MNFSEIDYKSIEEYKTINLDKLVYILSISNNFDEFKININILFDELYSLQSEKNSNNKFKKLKKNYDDKVEKYLLTRTIDNTILDGLLNEIDSYSVNGLKNFINDFPLINNKNSYKNLTRENKIKKLKEKLLSYKK